MKKFPVYLILASMLLSGTVACAEQDDPAGTTPTVTTAAQTEAQEDEGNGREFTKDSLPETMDFEGRKVRILTRNGDEDTKLEFFSEGIAGEVVNDAVFKRNSNVSERLHVTIEPIFQNVNRHSHINDQIRNSVNANSDDYDIIGNHMSQSMALTTENLFYDLNQVEYINFEQPWWNQSFVEMTQWNGKNYLALGELSQTMISGAFCMFFNKDMFATYLADKPSIYDTVINGEWTLDKLIEYSAVYTDANGNSKPDEGDIFGHYYTAAQTLAADAFFGASQINLVAAEEDEYLFNGTGDRMAAFGEKMHKLLFEDNNTLRLKYNDSTILKTLAADQTIFTSWMLGGINLLRDMESDFGILPMPKLDENQADYATYIHNGSSAFGIPSIKSDTEMEGAFLEAMAAETYRVLTPAYFEVALKVKYSRDNETAVMLDMLVDSVYLDHVFLYNAKLNGPLTTIRETLANSSACQKIISTMASKEKSILKSMENLQRAYDKLQ